MTVNLKPTKKQLLKMIDSLEKNPQDKIRILGDTGITLVGAGLGAAAAGTVASAAGATSIFGLTTAASWFGVTLVSATPVGWIIGCAAVGGAAVYGVSRLVHDGGLAEGRKLELLQQYRQAANEMEAKERAGNINDKDKTTFIISIRELIDKDVMTPQEASDLIEHVEQGRIPLSQAFAMIEKLLSETPSTDIKRALSKEQVKLLEYLDKAHKDGFISDEDFNTKVNEIVSMAAKKSLSKEQVAQIEYIEKAHKDGFISDSDFEKRVNEIMSAVTFENKKNNILSSINLDKTTENISESVQEKASAALDLLKGAKKDIFNRFK
jgi:hypothetical protein